MIQLVLLAMSGGASPDTKYLESLVRLIVIDVDLQRGERINVYRDDPGTDRKGVEIFCATMRRADVLVDLIMKNVPFPKKLLCVRWRIEKYGVPTAHDDDEEEEEG